MEIAELRMVQAARQTDPTVTHIFGAQMQVTANSVVMYGTAVAVYGTAVAV